jgi:hypothetical protein
VICSPEVFEKNSYFLHLKTHHARAGSHFIFYYSSRKMRLCWILLLGVLIVSGTVRSTKTSNQGGDNNDEKNDNNGDEKDNNGDEKDNNGDEKGNNGDDGDNSGNGSGGRYLVL